MKSDIDKSQMNGAESYKGESKRRALLLLALIRKTLNKRQETNLTDAFRNGLTMSKMNRTCLIRKQITVGIQLHQLIVHESKDDYVKINIKMITIVRIVRMEIYTT